MYRGTLLGDWRTGTPYIAPVPSTEPPRSLESEQEHFTFIRATPKTHARLLLKGLCVMPKSKLCMHLQLPLCLSCLFVGAPVVFELNSTYDKHVTRLTLLKPDYPAARLFV